MTGWGCVSFTGVLPQASAEQVQAEAAGPNEDILLSLSLLPSTPSPNPATLKPHPISSPTFKAALPSASSTLHPSKGSTPREGLLKLGGDTTVKGKWKAWVAPPPSLSLVVFLFFSFFFYEREVVRWRWCHREGRTTPGTCQQPLNSQKTGLQPTHPLLGGLLCLS